MSRTYANHDTYVGDDLRWKTAMVIDQFEHHQLTVKARHATRPNAWENVIVLVDAEFAGTQGEAMFWEGTDKATGESVRLAAIPRQGSGCIPCSQR